MTPITPGEGRHVGLTGLAVMGQNLARNIARSGFALAVHNRTSSKIDRFLEDHGAEATSSATTTWPTSWPPWSSLAWSS